MAIEEILATMIAPLLLGAALVSLLHIVRQHRVGKRVTNDFTVLLSVFIVGWLTTEMLATVSSGTLKELVDWAHLLILIAFASMLTLRWRSAVKEATESMRSEVGWTPT